MSRPYVILCNLYNGFESYSFHVSLYLKKSATGTITLESYNPNILLLKGNIIILNEDQ